MNGNMCTEDVYTFARTGRVEKLAKPKAILCQSENSKQNMHTFSMMNYNYMAQQMPTFIQFKCQREKKKVASAFPETTL